MPRELNTSAALLVPDCVLLSVLPVVVVGVVPVGVAVIVDVVVPVEAVVPVVAGVAAVVAVVPFVLVPDAAEPPGNSPSWLSAEKMLSMNPIMPPPESWLSCTPSWSLSPSLPPPCRCAW